ncbi:MAG: flagellar basal-body MS-ring/collar protein FliF [Candidatus Competibacter denitrificans]|uniref:Flagellar M-ring protein n=1 Tax=Candidatus Competibacter denitrificans Run_A_D11 TaxID=1400863 RepID=W6M7N8_9GAMM|nr:flagellar basal-body MS-ring/collar protein FliF [Candidatus Competibacter denitrificans]CDI02604.1 Flagellar M-ring protein [Candidatus Competibacter denitrificans Run_A_D11]HAS87054.1 flagellar basal body M-ring protein FliF [Candidatus Competibacteraceae bacterium]HRC69052.1 flagellar basal-body MS-ring/collar protein FliF [Candidatus Competibacter denitrificans]
MAGASNPPIPNPSAGIDWRAALAKFRRPGPAQIGILAGLAALLALMVAGALWLNTPTYDALYRGLAEADAGQIMEALQKAAIPFKIDPRSGALLVPADQVHQARLKLAGQGLPRGTVNGLEALEQKNSFGVSQFMETARYQHALEGELARSVMTIGSVEAARIHLAFPKETVFARQQQPPTASVLVRLHPGRTLDAGQVAAIVHLIASSVPKLSPDKVSVIDQAGNLLTRPEREDGSNLNLDQLEYTRRLEERYARRVEDLLAPLWGAGRVRAQVALDLDFTASEETAERYEPRQEPRPVRSEQLLEETQPRPQAAGIPGALSNQPPGVATAPETTAANPANPAQAPQTPATPGTTAPPQSASNTVATPTRKETTRNYELDKRVTHSRAVPGRLVRVSAAVVVDDRTTLEAGQPVRKPLSAEEIERITALVKQAVGFNAERGDSVNVLNAAFAPAGADEPPLPMWQQPWFLELVKWGVVGVLSLAVLVLVVRPLLRRALATPATAQRALEANETPTALPAPEEGVEGLLEDQVHIGGIMENTRPKSLTGPSAEQLEERMELARSLVAEDPKRAVQVIRGWLASES